MTIKIFRNKYLKSNEFFQINIILYFPRTQECPNVSELNMCPTRVGTYHFEVSVVTG